MPSPLHTHSEAASPLHVCPVLVWMWQWTSSHFIPPSCASLVSKRSLNLTKSSLISDNFRVSESLDHAKAQARVQGKCSASCQCKATLGVQLVCKETHKQRAVIFNTGVPLAAIEKRNNKSLIMIGGLHIKLHTCSRCLGQHYSTCGLVVALKFLTIAQH